MLLDIVILPNKKTSQQIGNFAKRINLIHSAPCVVDNIKLIPHISLYHFNVDKNKLPQVIDVVKKVAANVKKISVKNSRPHIGRIAIDIGVKSSEIRNLNKKILKVCAPLRSGVMPFTFKYKATPAIKKALANYGTVGTVVNYDPHITLLVNMKGFDKSRLIKENTRFSFESLSVAVCQINRWYQVTKVLKKFKV